MSFLGLPGALHLAESEQRAEPGNGSPMKPTIRLRSCRKDSLPEWIGQRKFSLLCTTKSGFPKSLIYKSRNSGSESNNFDTERRPTAAPPKSNLLSTTGRKGATRKSKPKWQTLHDNYIYYSFNKQIKGNATQTSSGTRKNGAACFRWLVFNGVAFHHRKI